MMSQELQADYIYAIKIYETFHEHMKNEWDGIE
jgi:hypothetical protein